MTATHLSSSFPQTTAPHTTLSTAPSTARSASPASPPTASRASALASWTSSTQPPPTGSGIGIRSVASGIIKPPSKVLQMLLPDEMGELRCEKACCLTIVQRLLAQRLAGALFFTKARKATRLACETRKETGRRYRPNPWLRFWFVELKCTATCKSLLQRLIVQTLFWQDLPDIEADNVYYNLNSTQCRAMAARNTTRGQFYPNYY